MTTIWKYPLMPTEEQVIDMPGNARILYVDNQGEFVTLWAMVEPDAASEPRKFRIVGTGHDADPDLPYIGSCQLHKGSLVWHVFEVIE